ncbi:4761_t:CDS:2 [Acaulospora colombiana]|uniref:4761_t:CDS:1 n=1 Tax=Acaulospora colombiana TaxID=27376 RepID=A0ACA9K8F4_9GLOM|nr:4761_t:CDS:2 [Acaulospora colombiana]
MKFFNALLIALGALALWVDAQGAATQNSPSVIDSPTSTSDQTPASSSAPDTASTQSSTDDSSSLATFTAPLTASQSSTSATTPTAVLQPSPCLSNGQQLSLSSCADTTNYYCNITTSMCVPKLSNNSSCTSNLMCQANSTCQNSLCVPLAANTGGSGVAVGKIGIAAGVIAGIFVLAGIAFWAYRFLSKRKELEEDNRRMQEPYGSKTNSTLETSSDYPFISRPNSFSNSNMPPPAVSRPEMRTFDAQGFGGAMNNNSYGVPPPMNQYDQRRGNDNSFGGNDYAEDKRRSSKYNYLSNAFTRMRNSLGYGLSNSQPQISENQLNALPKNELNFTQKSNYRLSDVENNLEDDNTTLRDSSVLPADDQEVFSLASESIYLGLDFSDQSAAQQNNSRRYKMGSVYSQYTESWGSNHMLGDVTSMPTGPITSQTTKDRKNLRDKKNAASTRTTLFSTNDDQVPRQSVMELNAPIFNIAAMRQQKHLPQPSAASAASSGFSLNYYNSTHNTERTLAPTNERGRLVYSSTFGDESEHSSSGGEENLTIEEQLSRQEYIDQDISELEKDIESVRKFAWNN